MRKSIIEKSITKEEIGESIYKIKDSDNSYLTRTGKIFIEVKEGLFYQKATYITHGYVYIKIKYNGVLKSRRVHRLLAEQFLENPNNYNIVGHKNNIKDDNDLNNLYWTTIQENTQKAYDDKLAKNDKGYEDSQSMPVYHCDLDWNIINDYGSITICAKTLGISISTVARQARKGKMAGAPRGKNRFCFQSEYNEIVEHHKNIKPLIYALDKSGKIVGKYSTMIECAKDNGVNPRTVSTHLKKPLDSGFKPRGLRFCYVEDYKSIL